MAKLFALYCLIFFNVGTLSAKSDDDYLFRVKTPVARDYDSPVNKEEKRDIAYIVLTVGDPDRWTIGLLRDQPSLEAAGNRIYHVHPLRFLMCVFTDRELTQGIQNIYQKGGFAWRNFITPLKNSLKEEYYRNNLRDDQLTHFAEAIRVNHHILTKIIHKQKWNDFVIYLINNAS
jgi:hypothetical protein